MTADSTLESPFVSLKLPAAHRYLNIVSACLAALLERVESISERDSTTYNVQLAVHEACTNIVDHAYDGRIGGRIELRIALVDAPRHLAVDLYDDGQPFDACQDVELDLDAPQAHGYGLFLMRALVDDVQYERVADRNHWRLSKQL